MDLSWGERMLEVVRHCDRFNHSNAALVILWRRLNVSQFLTQIKGKSTDDCMAFHVGNEQYGVIRNDSWRELAKFPDVFSVDERQQIVKLTDQLQNPHERTEKVNKVLVELRENQVFHCLKGWRNEVLCRLLSSSVFNM